MDIIILTVLVISAVLLVALLLRSFANKPQDQQEQQNTTAKTLQENAGLRKEIELTQSLLKDTETQRDNLQDELTVQKSKVSELETELKNERQNLTQRNDLEKLFVDQFENMSVKTVENQQKQFIQRATETLKPLSDKVGDLNREWVNTSGAFKQQIETLAKETQTLSSALRKPQTKGGWAEIQVERVLYLSGLKKDIHYKTQITDKQGRRPDFTVYMPPDRNIILDSKVSLEALMEAQDTTDEKKRDQLLEKHARSMEKHFKDLANKEYPKNSPDAPDFVVMVVPEFAFLHAVERRPEIVEQALQKKVVITTYSTLFALLKTVEMGWQERKLAKHANEIGILGRELHDRLETFVADHYGKIGESLDDAIEHYNDGVGSLERRVLPQARRFLKLGIQSTKEIPEVNPIDTTARPLKSSTTTNNHQHTNNQHTTKTSHTPSTSNN